MSTQPNPAAKPAPQRAKVASKRLLFARNSSRSNALDLICWGVPPLESFPASMRPVAHPSPTM